MGLSDKEIREFWDKLCKDNPVKPINQDELAKLSPPFHSLVDLTTKLDESKLEARRLENSEDAFCGLSVEQFLAGNDFNKFCCIRWGKEWGDVIPKILTYRLEGIYQTDYCRRSYRSTKNAAWYYQVIREYMNSLNHLRLYGLGPKELLDLWMERGELFSGFYPPVRKFLPQLIALELDGGNKKLADFLHTAVYEDSGQMSHIIIDALCSSHLERSWKMLADLLLAAQLQEGLRQAITELCCERYLPAFRYLLKVIDDNNLLRFSSVKRAFDTWTGMGLESVRESAFKKYFKLAYQYLSDPQKAKEALQSDNPMEVFLGLWAIGNTEIEDAQAIALQKSRDTSVPIPTKTACLLFCTVSDYIFTWEEAASFLELYRSEDILRACVLQNTLSGRGGFPWEQSKSSGMTKRNIDDSRKLFERFKALIPTLPEKEVKIGHPIFSWLELGFSSQKVWEFMIDLARDSLDRNLIDELVAMAPQMPLNARDVLLHHVLEFLSKKSVYKRGNAV